ncbi:hypothetical protein BAUCODRAFT_395451 [Baudoinia panamericana UAMH 10762]|uniref:Uncharacterized protein n=1 Tax=Baudoinia panamericana (strain UAMH 10762) TaxID=717646 RepID=M2N5A8_BAUPA|nr:uncharacterized protein BAUCODRAFT_395451 [Baudoinia panamericana UAMH 10762]EMC99213.1 hypothetical protein BAUCODRAFT_395451 [Baudoinia panamericana UAMH 10762]
MADDDASSSTSASSDGEDIETTGLIATRAKRSTAGNLYAVIRNNLDDEDVRKELLAEDETEEDAREYEGSEPDEDDEDALESSSEDEDAGPPQEGEPEDLAGEKEVRKAERVEQSKKRKVQDARLKLPSWQRKTKRVKLADDVKTEDGETLPAKPKSKKKSERANWLPTDADAPLRQSGRALAVASREVTHANLKQSYERSEKQRKVMKDAAQRENLKKRKDMSQEDRMAQCAKIALKTDKEFGRWEREEAEKQRLRDEALAAKRRRGVEGPFLRHWSGSVIWRGSRIEEQRVRHGSVKVDDVGEGPSHDKLGGGGMVADVSSAVQTSPTGQPDATAVPPNDSTLLSGIHDYAAKATEPPNDQASIAQVGVPQAGITNPAAPVAPLYQQPQPTAPLTQPPPALTTFQHAYTGWPPSSHPTVGPPPPAPLLREQAQRSLIMLEQFPNLDPTTTTTKRSTKASASTTPGLTPTETTSILLPTAYPPFTSDQLRYLLAKHSARRRTIANTDNMPPPPEKAKCAIIPNQDAAYRDPKTGLPYLDLQCYKIIQRVLGGGCMWSGLLGAWVGPSLLMGRPARGVPEGFATGVGAGEGKVKGEVG